MPPVFPTLLLPEATEIVPDEAPIALPVCSCTFPPRVAPGVVL